MLSTCFVASFGTNSKKTAEIIGTTLRRIQRGSMEAGEAARYSAISVHRLTAPGFLAPVKGQCHETGSKLRLLAKGQCHEK